MTTRDRSEEFPCAFAYEHTDILAGLAIREWRETRRAVAPTAPAAAGAMEAIQMIGWRVIVIERRTRGLVDSDGISYVSPPQTEEQARSLIALLAGTGVKGSGPWRQPVAGGQRLIELQARR